MPILLISDPLFSVLVCKSQELTWRSFIEIPCFQSSPKPNPDTNRHSEDIIWIGVSKRRRSGVGRLKTKTSGHLKTQTS